MTRAGATAEEGFALLETIVAFLILATALAVGVQAIGQSVTALRRAEEMTAASVVLDELAATELQGLSGAGILSGTHGGSAWRIAATVLADGEGVAPLLAVVVDVQPPGARAPYSYRSVVVGAEPE